MSVTFILPVFLSPSEKKVALNHTTEGNKISHHLETAWKQICPHEPPDENLAQVNTLIVVLQRIPLSHACAPGSYHFKAMWFYFIILKMFWPCYAAYGIFIPWAGIEPLPSALETWNLNHWTARQVPTMPGLLTHENCKIMSMSCLKQLCL